MNSGNLLTGVRNCTSVRGPDSSRRVVQEAIVLNARIRLRAENERLQQEVALLRAEIRIKDARMKALTPEDVPMIVEG